MSDYCNSAVIRRVALLRDHPQRRNNAQPRGSVALRLHTGVALFLSLSLLCPLLASAQVTVVPDAQPPAVFAGREQTIRVLFQNQTDQSTNLDLRVQLRQLSFSSSVRLGDPQPWKQLRLLPNQTVVETYATTFPSVRAATRFQIEWLGIGRTEIVVYPNDLLKKLSALAGEKPPALLDPDNQIRPVLKQARIEFTDMETEPSDARLAVMWSNAKELPETVIKRVKDGMAAVWIRKSAPVAAYAVRLGTGTVIVASTSSVTPLADSPMAQLNLIRFAELALEPEAMRLPEDRKETE